MWLKGRWSRSWLRTSRTCTWFTVPPTASPPRRRAGSRDMCWAPPLSPSETLPPPAPSLQRWPTLTTSSKSRPPPPALPLTHTGDSALKDFSKNPCVPYLKNELLDLTGDVLFLFVPPDFLLFEVQTQSVTLLHKQRLY